ncbi:polynucleotide kinase [Erwinia phage phiEaP8]|uniref:Polynucleotide kinase n=2 Tax=Caudoviricetes TaxID=2731619 RepID=A0A3G1QTN4_9CAUD|nr:Sak4-like ssDNA annealing protein [Erwinia phage phiEaP8]AWN06217.1 polynucleotide kinase [Erwinia phage phiEaP8]
MAQNKNVIMIMGKPNTGKTTSLRNMDQESMIYLNADLKDVPFRDRFLENVEIADANDTLGFIEEIENAEGVTGAVLDTITFLMQMYERQYVAPFAGTKTGQSAWGDYGNFYRNFIHAIKSGSKSYVIMAHEDESLNEQSMMMESRVPIKGAVGKVGVEADFTTVLRTMQIPVKKLEGHENDLLTITDEEREDGVKYVFQTRVTKETAGGKMRSAMGLWSRNELFIDNDVALVMKRLNEFYGK